MSRMMAPAGKNAPKPQQLPDRYRIVASDPFGPLPIIEAQNPGTPSSDEMRIERIVRTLAFTPLARSQILELLPDSRFLSVTTVGSNVTLSCQSGHRIWKARTRSPSTPISTCGQKSWIGVTR